MYYACMHSLYQFSPLENVPCIMAQASTWTCIQVPRSQSSQTVSHTGYLCVPYLQQWLPKTPEDLTKGEELLSL